MSVEVDNLTKMYGSQRAVDSIGFSVRPGEVVGFLGPNGAGKSTTMKMLTTYVLPDAGTIRICDRPALDNPLAVRRQLGYLPENNPLYPEMYVREYLRFSGNIHGMGGTLLRQRIAEMIALTGLEREAHKRIGALSKGYRQRVGLAQALLHSPPVLILDEPTSGLDPNQIVEIRELIKNAGAEKTVLLSTHIMQEVEAICDRVLILDKGRIVADSPTHELLHRKGGGLSVRVRFRDPCPAEALENLQGVRRVQAYPDHWLVEGEHGALPETLFYEAVRQHNPLLELRPVSESLESVFQALTRSENEEAGSEPQAEAASSEPSSS